MINPNLEAIGGTRVRSQMGTPSSDRVPVADNFFGSYLPALNAWPFGYPAGGRLPRAVLSVLGTETDRGSRTATTCSTPGSPQVEDGRIEGVAHLLHVQRPEPVARGIAEFWPVTQSEGKLTDAGAAEQATVAASCRGSDECGRPGCSARRAAARCRS